MIFLGFWGVVMIFWGFGVVVVVCGRVEGGVGLKKNPVTGQSTKMRW